MADEREPATTSRRQLLKNAAGAAAAVGLAAFIAAPGTRSRPYSRRIPVHYWHLLNGEWQEPMERVCELFNRSQAQYEVIPLLITGSEADTKLMLSAAGGDPPDVFLIWTQGTSVWAEGGILHPLDTLMTPAERRWYTRETFPAVRKSGWHKGHLYGIVMGFDLFVVYYRPDHFREAGISYDPFPATLEELTALGEKLTRFDKSGDITRIGFMPSGLNYFVPSFGGGYYDERTGRLTLDTPQNLRALQYMVDTRKKLGLANVLRYQSGLSGDSGASWPFIPGAYSITVDGEWRVEQIRRYAPHLEYKTTPIPPPAGGKSHASFSMTNFLVIPSGARQLQGGWEFVRFWTGLVNPERAAEYYPWFGWMPLAPAQAKVATYEAWLKRVPNYRTFLEVAESENIAITPPVPTQLYLMDRIARADDMAMRGTLTPEQSLKQLEHDMATERARRRMLGYAE